MNRLTYFQDIQWYQLASLPGYRKSKGQQKQVVRDETASPMGTVSASKLYMVAPFLAPLKKWISQRQKERAASIGIRLTSTSIDQKPTIDENDPPDEATLQQPEENKFATQRPREADQVAAVDAATRLKRLLSVGATAPSLPSHAVGINTYTTPGDMLALLQHGSKLSANPPAGATDPPQTPLDQIDFQSPEPRSPRHQHPPPPLFSTMPPPPAFPYTPSHVHAQDRTASSQLLPRSRQHYFNKHNGHPLSNGFPDLRTSVPSAFVTNSPVRFSTAAGPFSRQVPRPYQRTGDPQFAQLPDKHVPSIPPAANLPRPKLSNHALNLLNAFKGTDKHSPTKIADLHESSVALQSAPERSQQQSPFVMQMDHATPGNSRARNSTLNSQSHKPGNEATSTSIDTAPVSASVGMSKPYSAAKDIQPSSAHQDALLKLFRVSSVTKPVTAKVQIPMAFLAPEPAELSAMPSPGLMTLNKQFPHLEATTENVCHIVPPNSSPELPLHAMVSLVAEAAPMSATVTGPQDVPDFGTVRRRPRNTKQRNDGVEHSDQRHATPIRILKRPIEAAKPVTPSRVVHKPREVTSTQPKLKPATVAPKDIPLKPFQPQILRRPPQGSSSVSEPNSPEQTAKAIWQKSPTQLLRDDTEFAQEAQKEDQGRLLGAPNEYQPTYHETFRRTTPGDVLGLRKVISVTKSNHSHSPAAVPAHAAPLPAGASPPPVIAAPYFQPFDRQISAADSHKQTLLSLFSKARMDTAQAAVTTSVVSPLSVISGEFNILPTTNGQLVRTRTNSIVGGDGKTAKVELSRSRINSIASAPRDGGKNRAASGPLTPISPLDRGFLLNYLEGVIKSVGR